jgi:hypothetical protein
VEASLYQLIAAARLPGNGLSEIAVNASLAFIEGAKPQDEVECALQGLRGTRLQGLRRLRLRRAGLHGAKAGHGGQGGPQAARLRHGRTLSI